MKTEIITTISEAEETRRGELIAQVLGLKPDREYRNSSLVRYVTEWGTKTSLGLFRTMQRIVIDGE